MNLFGPVRWSALGWLALLLLGPAAILAYPLPALSILGATVALLGAHALWRRLEPIPPALAAPDRPLGLPAPDGAPAALRPEPEAMGPAGLARATRRTALMPRTYGRVAAVLAVLSAGVFCAGIVVDVNLDSGAAAAVFYSAGVLLAGAGASAAVGVALLVRDSRRLARG